MAVTLAIPDKRPFPSHLQTVGDHIKYARLCRGILIKDVIEQLNITRDTLKSWEIGRYQPFPKHFPAIVSFLGYYPLEQETATLGDRIKKQRLLLGLSQKEFAQFIGTNATAVQYWEDNRKEPNPKDLLYLKRIFPEI